MSNRVSALTPPYPVYQPTPIFGGRLPTIDEIGPPDVRPSSAINPSLSVHRGTWGRNVAGLGATEMQAQEVLTADEGIRDYPNELNILAAAEDVQGNGVFDPPGSHGNVHPDYGVFADHESLPGYVVRDRFYRPSQVIDGTTGAPVMYVPSGAVAIDQSQRETVRERQLLYENPPNFSPQPVSMPSGQSTVIPDEYAFPVAGLGQDGQEEPEKHASSGQMIAGFVIVGVAVGLFAATVMGK